MILEGLVTTLDADGGLHLAAMGPEVDDAFVPTAGHDGGLGRLVFKPFPSSLTAANLLRERAGVFHVTDDSLLLARVVAGAAAAPPVSLPAGRVRGRRLADVCRAYEFEIESVDESQERLRCPARVVAVHEGRPFRGFNRAAHAVVEGAILVTRLHLLGHEEVRRRFAELAVLVEKTAGARDREAFDLLVARVAGS
jgi:hypothetical protein